MKVTRDTPDQLIIANSPWLIGLMLIIFILIFVGAGLLVMTEEFWIGLLFAGFGGGIGLGAFVAFVSRVQLILDRPTNSVTLRARSLFGFSEVRHALSDLTRAELDSTTESKGGTLYRPALVLTGGMSAGTHPILNAYTNGTSPQRMVAAINTWLEASPS
ncbi:MAG: hypothetical protein COC12_01470 [Rhodobacteraceae bacterium]|nr:MAG: hypothetical protein COC12_01470 [Paracoccaceae bacterium]